MGGEEQINQACRSRENIARSRAHLWNGEGEHLFRQASGAESLFDEAGQPRFVTVRGGEYLFVPSIAGLRSLSV